MDRAELTELFGALVDRLDRLESKLAAPKGDMRVHFRREDAAQYLGIGTRKLDELAADGSIRRCKVGEGPRAVVIFRREDLDQFVAERLELDAAGARRAARRL